MLPLKDENPTERPAILTWVVVLACIGIWFFWQREPSRDQVEDLEFNLEWTAVPCELTSGEPLSVDEVRATFDSTTGGNQEACGVGSDNSPQLFPNKSVVLSALIAMFLHGGLVHLGGNMLYLWIFGNNVEDRLGRIRFALFYLAGGVAATATHVALQPDSTIPVVGASGAIAAVMGAYMVWFPDAPVRTLLFLGWFIFFRDIRAKWLLGFWVVLQFFTAPESGVAWAAHVGGFVFGVVFGLVVRLAKPARKAVWRDEYVNVGDHWDPTGGAGHDPYEARRFGGRRY